MANARCSVVICTKDRPDAVVALLARLLQQTVRPGEIVVVEGGGPSLSERPEFTEIGRSLEDAGTLLAYERTKPGLTIQRNRGKELACEELVVFLDDDASPAGDFLEALTSAFERSPQCAGGMGAIQNVRRRPLLGAFQRLFMLTHNYGSGRLQLSGLPSFPQGRSDFCETEVLSGACMAYRRPVLEGYDFDGKLVGYGYMEDIDFSFRVSRAHRLFYEPKARVAHPWVSPTGRASGARARMFVRNHGYLFFKNVFPQRRFSLVFYCWSVLGYLIMHALRLDLTALVGGARGVIDVAGRWWTEPDRA